jgi:hypothetical protein
MTSEGLGEMFEGDSKDTCAGKFPLMLMVGRTLGLACTAPEARASIFGNFYFHFFLLDTVTKIPEGVGVGFLSCQKGAERSV